MTPIAGSTAPQVVHSMHRMHLETFTRFFASRSMGQRGAAGIALGARVSAEAQVEYADAVEQRQETPEGAEHLAPGAMNEGHPHRNTTRMTHLTVLRETVSPVIAPDGCTEVNGNRTHPGLC